MNALLSECGAVAGSTEKYILNADDYTDVATAWL